MNRQRQTPLGLHINSDESIMDLLCWYQFNNSTHSLQSSFGLLNFPNPLLNVIMSNTDDCTLQTCPLSAAYIQYQPNMAGNIFYLALFAIILIGQIGTGIVFRSWSFTVPMVAGLILEIIGYLGRILLHDNPFSFNDFLMWVTEPTT